MAIVSSQSGWSMTVASMGALLYAPGLGHPERFRKRSSDEKIPGAIAKRIHNSVDLFRNAGLVVSSKNFLMRLLVQKRVWKQ
jgi:hypothetical protein